MLTQLTRFVLATAGALAGLAVVNLINWPEQIGFPETIVIILFVILGASIGFIFGGIIGRELTRAFLYVEDYVRRMSAAELLLAVVGLIVGLLVALLISYPIRLVEPAWIAITGTVMVFFLCAYGGVRVALLKRADFGRAFPRLQDPRAQVSLDQGPKLLDTSAVIDGRFADIAAAGFIEGEVRVPGFVLSELQTLSDSADDVRRARGKRGLDLLATLRSGDHPVEVFEADYPEIPDVDGKLVQLAKDTQGVLVTVDHNLTQVARVQGIGVLNFNELAAALRPTHLPGERLYLHVVRDGKEPDQGVGYLEDGTMVVIQDGREYVGADVNTVVTSVLQTSGGRMLFAKLENPS
jgi:uncharacterized protein YacL